MPSQQNQPILERIRRRLAGVLVRLVREEPREVRHTKFVLDWVSSKESIPSTGLWKSLVKRGKRDELKGKQLVKQEANLKSAAGVVQAAIGSNVCLFVAKFTAAMHTGSTALFAEAVHSFADILNESLLLLGIRRSLYTPDDRHPYGFSAERYAWALVSGVGIFFLGCGLSIYNGVLGVFNPPEVQDPFWAFVVLGCCLFFEGGTMLLAARQIYQGARRSGVSFLHHVKRGADPTSVQVLLEDTAGTAGVIIAGSSLALSQHLSMPVLDPIGSIAIGCVLGGVAAFLIRRNISSLIDNSMNPDRLKLVIGILESEGTVRSVHDVKSTCLGPESVRFKAEIELNGAEVARRYLHKNRQQLDLEFDRVLQSSFQSREEVKTFLLKHAGGIVEHVGDEVDRLEYRIQENVPEIKHCDLVIL